MQSIATYTEEEIEQIRQVQRIIRTGTRKELAEYMASVRAGYTTPEYLKQQGMQMQE